MIAWVMPCASCIADPLDAYVVVNSYASSHPGRVLFYLVDDVADNTCQTLTSWGNNYGMTNCPKFSDARISMYDYGSPGMPKIVVLGATDHQVYFNKNNYKTSVGIAAAIDKALIGENIVGINENQNSSIELISFPNPANTSINLTYTLTQSSIVKFEVIDMVGKVVNSTDNVRKEFGKHKEEFNTSSLNNGIYFIKVSSDLGVETVRFTVSH